MRKHLGTATLVAGLLALVAGLCLQPMGETDLFFRLAMGEQLLRTGSVVRTNLFSFTYPEHPYPDPAWLFDASAAALHRVGGFTAIVVAKTLVVVAIFAGAFVVCRRRGAGPIAAALSLAAAALVMRERLVERPHLFSLAGELALLALLTPSPSLRRLPWLVPLTASWANLHAGAFVAPLFTALTAAGAGRQGRRVVLGTLAAAAGAAAALLLTPVGPGLFRYLAAHVGLFALHPVDEFRPASWTSDAPLLGHLAVSLVAVAVARRLGRLSLSWSEVLPLLGMAALALSSVRFGADLVLLTTPLLATSLSALAPVGARPRLAAAAGAALLLAAIVPRIAAARSGGRFLPLGLDESAVPLAAVRFAETHGLRERMYNDFEVGAYLAWQGFPRHRVFVDPRLPAYPRELHELLGRATMDRAGWDAALERHGVTSALLTHAGINHRIGWWSPERWALVHRAHDARIFVRRLERWRPLIMEHEVPATFTFSAAEGTTTVPLAAPPADSPVRPCEWQRRLGDLLFELDGGRATRAADAYRLALATPGCLSPSHEANAASWLGAVELERGAPAAALAALDRAVVTGARDLATLTNRAVALERLGRRAEASAAWREIATRAAGTPLGDRARHRAGR